MPNALLETLMRCDLGPRAMRVMLFLTRQTAGYHRASVELSYADIAAATNVGQAKVPEVLRGRPHRTTPAPMAPGQALYYPDPGAARSAWRSLKNRGHPARVGRNEAGRWFVVIEPKEDPDA